MKWWLFSWESKGTSPNRDSPPYLCKGRHSGVSLRFPWEVMVVVGRICPVTVEFVDQVIHPVFGGHLNLWKGHLTIPKRSQRIAREVFLRSRFNAGLPERSTRITPFKWSCSIKRALNLLSLVQHVFPCIKKIRKENNSQNSALLPPKTQHGFLLGQVRSERSVRILLATATKTLHDTNNEILVHHQNPLFHCAL